MFCSGCGQEIATGQGFCAQCGRPVAAAVPPIPGPGMHGLEFQLQNFDGKIKALSLVWFIYAAFNLLAGFIGLAFLKHFLFNHFSPWMQSPQGPFADGSMPDWFMPAIVHVALVFVILRSALAFAAAWGLHARASWGRILAIIAAFLCLFRIPFGTALGIWTLVQLLGYRNATLYEQL